MFIINQKKRKKALLRNGKNLKAIHDEYYETKVFINTIYDRTYVSERFVHHTKDIIERYNIGSIHELIFLLHRYCGEVIRDCEFCGHQVTQVKTRSNDKSLDDCGCRGICPMCKKIYHHGVNDDGICYDCKPWKEETHFYADAPESIRYRFLRYIGNHEFLCNIDTKEEAEKMADCAAEYYHWFKRIANDLSK